MYVLKQQSFSGKVYYLVCFSSFVAKGIKEKAKIMDLNIYRQNGGSWGNATDDWKTFLDCLNLKEFSKDKESE